MNPSSSSFRLGAVLAAIALGPAGCAHNRPGPEDFAAAPQAAPQARASGSGAPTAAALNELGLLEARSRRDAEALVAFSRAVDRARAADEPALAARAALNAADVLRREGHGEAARAAVALSLSFIPRLPPSAEKSLLLSAAAARLAPAVPDRRESILRDALEAADAAGDLRTRSQALGMLGERAAEGGAGREALERTREAIFAAQASQSPDLLFRWEWQAARLARAAGDTPAALAHFRRAHESLAAFRDDLLAELRLRGESYRDAIGPAFLEYADLLLRASDGELAPGARRERLLEAREVIERMKAVELEDYFQDECVARLRSRERKLEALAPRTAVIYPVILPDRLDLLVSAGADIEKASVPVSAAALNAETRAFRRLLEKRTTHEYLPHAQRLHEWLVRPVSAFLAAHEVATIVVVPDGALRGIPFAALHDGTGFLTQRYALATAPALSLVAPGEGGLAGRRALVGGLSEPVQDFPGLPQVERELGDVGGLFESRLLGNEAFRVPAMRAAMDATPYSVVHIASHGEFDSDPRRTFLLTWDGRMTMDVLERLMKSGRLRDEPVELLTLSACRTAAGDDRAALGLAGVAVKSGARSALATLWYINDEASSLLVTEFYRSLAAGPVDKARALQVAQARLLSEPRYRHPGYWAPFLLIGNWQ
jgi:CHAT domain-containing protein